MEVLWALEELPLPLVMQNTNQNVKRAGTQSQLSSISGTGEIKSICNCERLKQCTHSLVAASEEGVDLDDRKILNFYGRGTERVLYIHLAQAETSAIHLTQEIINKYRNLNADLTVRK
jgi:hypothetical protein